MHIVKTCIRTYPGNPDDTGECWHEPLTRLPARIDVVRPIVLLAHQQVHGTTNLVTGHLSVLSSTRQPMGRPTCRKQALRPLRPLNADGNAILSVLPS